VRLVIDAAATPSGPALPLFADDGEYVRTIAALAGERLLARLPDRVLLSLYATELAERLREASRRAPSNPIGGGDLLVAAPFWPARLFEAADEPVHPAREVERLWPRLDSILHVERDAETLRAASLRILGGERIDVERYRAGATPPEQISADAFLFRNGELLLELRPPHASSYAGQWDVPGGRVAAGESTEAALVREMREELAIEVEAQRLAAVLDHRDATSGRLCRHFCYVVERWSGEPRAAEGQRLEWKRVDGLRELARAEPLSSLVPWLVDELRARGGPPDS
jgi:8-oxo-dGTP diphosphatase